MSKSAQKILNTAEQLFNQQSFSGVGVDLIRDESGCSKTTLYTYFKNKHQLVYSVLQTRDERFRQSLLTAVQEFEGLEALEKIYEDADYTYYLSSMRSQYIFIEYFDDISGITQRVDLVKALYSGIVTVEQLIDKGLDIIEEPKQKL